MEMLRKSFVVYTNILLVLISTFIIYGVAKDIRSSQEEEIIRVSSSQGNLRFENAAAFIEYYTKGGWQ